MNSILVPTELTYLSKCALDLGVQIAKLTQAKIEVLSVVEPESNAFMEEHDKFSHDPTSSIGNIQLTEKARARMQERTQEITELLPDRKVVPKIAFGDKVKTLVKEIDDQNIDLVVMGGDLYDPKDNKANEFLNTSSAPVIVLKCMISRLHEFKDIIFLADVDKDSDRLIDRIKELQSLLEANIHVVRVNTPKNFFTPKQCSETLESYIERNKLERAIPVSLDAKNELEGLMAYCETLPDAFVGMGLRQQSFLQSVIATQSKTHEIIANSAHPIWISKN